MPIRMLTPEVANLIAAGEVVERPASVVKELIENAIDAMASEISIEISKDTRSIQVSDNGSGIPKEELALALKRHATSKLTTKASLEAISSMGFRGEALASIAAASDLKLGSRTSKEEGWAVTTAGPMQTPSITPMAMNQGTIVHVKNLFEYVPARAKFLKSPKIELSHIDQIVKKIALAHPTIAFKLVYDGKPIYQLMPLLTSQSLPTRIEKLLGRTFIDRATSVNERALEMSLTGWVLPDATSMNVQYFYVNDRPVKDKVLSHAVKMSQEPGKAPTSYILFLTLPPSAFDVNVHPTKHEIRFIQAAHVHEFVTTALEKLTMKNPQAVPKATRIIERISQPLKRAPLNLCRGEKVLTYRDQQELYIVDICQLVKHIHQPQVEYILDKSVPGEALLEPVILHYSEKELMLIEENMTRLKEMGFVMRCLSKTSLQLTKVPAPLEMYNLHDVMLALVRDKTQALHAILSLITPHMCTRISSACLSDYLLTAKNCSAVRKICENDLLDLVKA